MKLKGQKLTAQKNQNRLFNEASMLLTAADSDLAARNNLDTAWDTLQRAMKIDEVSMKAHDTQSFLMGLVKMGFLAVIVGCEMDLYAFIMSFPTYWTMNKRHQIESMHLHIGGYEVDFTVIKLLLVILPAGFLLAVLMFVYTSDASADKVPPATYTRVPDIEEGRKNRLLSDEAGSLINVEQSTPIEEGYARQSAEKTQLRYYHFLPIFRYYLLIKDPEPEDIEGLFRVNALSTFTLGIAQAVCMTFHLWVLKGGWTLFVKVGMITQGWNFFVTLLYFLTPTSTKMKRAIEVDTLKHNVEEDMMKLYKEYLDAVAQYAVNPVTRKLQLKNHTERIHREIIHLGGLAAQEREKLQALLKFGMEFKLEALGGLRRIQYLKLARIAQ